MSTNNSNDWVREGTPREDWDADTDYGVEVDPAEWDDYAQEQAVPVRTPEAAREYVPPMRRAQHSEPEEEESVEQTQVVAEEVPDAVEPDAGISAVDEAPTTEPAPAAFPTHAVTPDVEAGDVQQTAASAAHEDERLAEEQPVTDNPVEESSADESLAEENLAQERLVDESSVKEQPTDHYPAEERMADESPVEDHPVEEIQGEQSSESTSPVDEFYGSYETADDEHTPVRPRPIVPEVAAEQPESITDAAVEPRTEDDPESTAVHSAVDRNEIGREPETQPEERIQPEVAEPQPEAEQSPDATPQHEAETQPEAEPQPEPEPRDERVEGEAAAAGAPLAADAVAAGPGDGAKHGDGQYASLYREEHQKVEPEPAAEQELEAETTQAFAPAVDHNTQVIDDERLAAEEAEERERQARLQEQRDARDARLGVVPSSQDSGVRVVTRPVKRQADKFFGAFSLFVLRGVLAAIIGVLAYQVLQNVARTEEFLAGTVVPEPRLVAWVLGYSLAVLAAFLLIGLGARFVSVLLVLISGASLALFRWGAFSIFTEGSEGFLGDRTLLTLAAALVIVAFGAGRWSIDGAIYAARQKSKETIDE
ncbi:hypothetical protein [uncultured Tessaracoccus sp.]|uniref:hypothetical protein n=1 Tax=uncultured Tessaracoccus sp. TaxID=905023 RepID=UPI002626A5B0|nr:hypothetical protein [uncultured Tessaracoccus sp.]